MHVPNPLRRATSKEVKAGAGVVPAVESRLADVELATKEVLTFEVPPVDSPDLLLAFDAGGVGPAAVAVVGLL